MSPVVEAAWWMAPWRGVFGSGLLADYAELVLVAAVLALVLTLILLDKHSRLRFWVGLAVLALAVKLFRDDGPIVQSVKDAARGVPNEIARWFR